MANFKRGKSRTQSTPHFSRRSWDKLPNKRSWLSRWPRSHDIIHHTRPRRRAEQRLAEAVAKGRIDPDNVAWPTEKKPHNYYW